MRAAIRTFILIAVVAMVFRLWSADDPGRAGDSTAAGADRSTTPLGESCDHPADWSSAEKFVGRRAALKGRVARITYRKDISGQPTWINLGAPYPINNRLDLMIWGRNRSGFQYVLPSLSKGVEVCAEGLVERYENSFQIELKRPRQVQIL